MLRQALLYLSDQPAIFRFVRRNPLARRFAGRFVAGETLEMAVQAVRQLNDRGITATLDLLGESVNNESEARAAGREYILALEEIDRLKLDSNVSLKLTAMGLDIADELCVDVMQGILERARELNNFVRIDMESSEYTERTLRLFEERLFPSYGPHVGIVLQSYLYRTQVDVEHANALRARVRLCKGAYKEPETVAFPDKQDVDANFARCMRSLMLEGTYPGLATHDEAIIRQAKAFAREQSIGPERFEFQMLYGIRRDLQEQLVREGWRMRVYVPYGTQWYPYLMRRLAERPSNVAFIAGSVARETLRLRR
ncbi:MAG TPA: proline dehydrogenase family protein [Gemmatimonadaceae bacterium]|nr:proline dehydrogenase family protein [Gemmatimonadaceae bacterium]